MWSVFAVAVVVVLIYTGSGIAFAQTQQPYPGKPIRIINPFTPGATFDVIARLVGQKMSESSPAWRLIVDSRPGADGRIGTQECAKAVPDGYTLCIGGASTHAIHASVFKNLPYDVANDFVPITIAGMSANVLAVNPAVRATTVQELIDLAKKEPGKLGFASAGTGTSTHLAGELFKDAAGVNILHVPYKGGAPATMAVMGNELPILMENISTAAPHVVSGKLRGLAISTIKRNAVLPDLPTLDESGLKGFDVGLWYAFFAPAATPRPIVDRLNAEMVKVLGLPEVRDILLKRGVDPRPMTPANAAAFTKAEIERYRVIVRKANVALE